MAPTDAKSIFTWLDSVRARPGMYIGAGTLRDVESLVYGYYAGLHTHGLAEHVPEMANHFSTWLYSETGWSTSCGWASAIISNAGARPPLDLFFELVDRYRTLRPVTLRSAKLSRRNAPTGKRVTVGLDGRIERPTRVDIVRYAPTRMHFLRFTYGSRKANDWILMTGDGSHETSLRFAKQWMADELQTRDEDWSA
jgi:hypothetical protein